MGIIDSVYPDGVPVAKANVRADDKTGKRRNMASVDDVRNADLSGQTAGIYVREIQQFYDLDTGDTTTPDDGDDCIIDGAGNRFKKLELGSGGSGSGDMLASVYDPNAVANDAFDSANHEFEQSGAGSAGRSVQDKLREYVSITDFGAVGDGDVANAAVNAAALTSALATGKTVLIPYTANGYHFGTNQITVSNGGCVIGENGVAIKSTATSSWLYLTANQGHPPLRVSNLSIDMSGSGSSSTAIRIGTNTRIVYGIRLDRLAFSNCVEAIGDEVHATNYVVDVHLDDVFCNFTRGLQIYLRRTRGMTRFQGVQVDHTFNAGSVTWGGVKLDDYAGVELNAVDVTGPTTDTTYHSAMYGINLNGSAGVSSAAAWLNRCNVDTGPGNGILVSGTSYVWVNDLDVVGNLGNQILISTCAKVEAVNVFSRGATGRTGAAAGAAGISFNLCTNVHGSNISTENNVGSGITFADSTDCLLSGVRSQDNGAVGLYESGTSDRNIVVNANFSSNTGGDVTLVGSNSRALFYQSGSAFSPIGVSSGGTGSKTASGARTNLGLGTAAIQNTGTSGANVPLLNGNNSHSGSLQVSGGFGTAHTTPPNLITTGISGAAPAASGSTDANQFLIAGNGNVQWRFGFYNDGTMWSQPSLQSDYSYNFGTYFQPNGGNVGVGKTPALASPSGAPTSTLTVGGSVATRLPQTKTSAYSQLVTDSSLIFNGAGSITLTLLSAASYPGHWLYIKTIAAQAVVSASSNVVPLVGGSAGTAILAATAGKWAWLQSDGSNWVIMAAN